MDYSKYLKEGFKVTLQEGQGHKLEYRLDTAIASKDIDEIRALHKEISDWIESHDEINLDIDDGKSKFWKSLLDKATTAEETLASKPEEVVTEEAPVDETPAEVVDEESKLENLLPLLDDPAKADDAKKAIEDIFVAAEDKSEPISTIIGAMGEEGTASIESYKDCQAKIKATMDNDQITALKVELEKAKAAILANTLFAKLSDTTKNIILESLDVAEEEAIVEELNNPEVRNALQEQLNSEVRVEGTVSEDYPEGLTAKEVWALGFRDLAILNRRIDNLQKNAKKLGLSKDWLFAIGGVLSTIGTVGFTITSLIVPKTPTIMIAQGAFKAVGGVGGMLATGPQAVKRFKNGDIKGGLAMSAACITAGLAAASGVKTIGKGVSWQNAVNLMNNPDKVIDDLTGKLEKTTDPAKRAQLQQSIDAATTVKEAKAAGILTDEQIANMTKDPITREALSKNINENVSKELESLKQEQANAALLAEQDAITEALERAEENGGKISDKDCARYIMERAGTGKNGGWQNSTTMPVNPKMEKAALEWANAHEDLVNSTKDIANAKSGLANAEQALTAAQGKLDGANAALDTATKNLETQGQAMGGFGFSNDTKKLVGNVYGTTTRTGGTMFNKEFSFEKAGLLKSDLSNMAQGKTDAIPVERLPATKAIFDAANADKAAGKTNALTSFVDCAKEYGAAQGEVDKANAAFTAAQNAVSTNKGAFQNRVNAQLGQLSAIANSPDVPNTTSVVDTPKVDLGNVGPGVVI